MTWDALSAEVAVMFGDYSHADEYEAQVTIEWWVRQRVEVKRENTRIWRATHKTYLREKNRQWRHSDEGRRYHREYIREWRAKNAERAKAAQRKQKRRWKEANREKFRAYMRAWRAANRETREPTTARA
jgi:hypothetical protein